MIENEVQFAITQAEWQQFTQTLSTYKRELEERPELWQHLHPLLIKAEQEALQSVIDDLHRAMETYAVTQRKEIPCEFCRVVHTCQLRPTGLLFAAWRWCCDECFAFATETH